MLCIELDKKEVTLLCFPSIMTVSKKQQGEDHPMAIIPQKELFGWKEIEDLGDLELLFLTLIQL
jgi:hypothetical protein